MKTSWIVLLGLALAALAPAGLSPQPGCGSGPFLWTRRMAGSARCCSTTSGRRAIRWPAAATVSAPFSMPARASLAISKTGRAAAGRRCKTSPPTPSAPPAPAKSRAREWSMPSPPGPRARPSRMCILRLPPISQPSLDTLIPMPDRKPAGGLMRMPGWRPGWRSSIPRHSSETSRSTRFPTASSSPTRGGSTCSGAWLPPTRTKLR